MDRRRRSGLLLVAAAGLCLTVTLGAVAHESATGVVKERMDLMKAMGRASRGLGDMFKGEAPYDEAMVLEHATVLAESSPKMLELFPEGSNAHPSETLAVTWERWDEFTEAVHATETESAALLELARTNAADQNAVRAQFARTGRTCSNCHEVFRKPKD